MKTIYFFIVFLCALAIQAKPVTIKGKINGRLPDVIRYTAPVNGKTGFDAYYTAKTDAQGNFEIKAETEYITFVDVYYNFQFVGCIVAQPGNTYSIIINEDKGEVNSEISSKDAEVQKLYNTILGKQRLGAAIDLSQKTVGIVNADELKKAYAEMLQKDTDAFNAVYTSKKINKEMYGALLRERKFFYAVSMAYNILIQGLKAGQADAVLAPELVALEKETLLYNTTPLAEIQRDPLGYYYIQVALTFRLYEGDNFKPSQTTTRSWFDTSRDWLDADRHEYFMAANIANDLTEGRKEESLLLQYEDFKKAYPKSTYTKFLEPGIAPIITFSKQKTTPEHSAFVAGYDKINSLEQLAAKFPGKKLYIDVWATWCGPCRDEFKYKERLYATLKEYNVAVVYISLDEEKRDEAWKKMINYYALQGYHLRVNKQLRDELAKLFNHDGNIAIPWYIMIGNDGTVKKLHAAAASNPDELKKQLEAL